MSTLLSPDDVVRNYRHGYCHYLALAMHENTGYELAVLVGDDAWLAHAGIVLPTGEFFDILGPQKLRDVENYYRDFYTGRDGYPAHYNWYIVKTPERYRRILRDHTGCGLDNQTHLDLARKVAQGVLV